MTPSKKNNIVAALLTVFLLGAIMAGCSEDKQTADTEKDSPTATPQAPDKPAMEPEMDSTSQQAGENITSTQQAAELETIEPTTESETPDEAPAPSSPENGQMSQSTAQTSEAPSGGATDHSEMLALARKSGCLACHSVEKKVVGPAWKDVAKRYAGNAGARSQLIEKVSKGGRGNWTEVVGQVAMPPYHPRVTKENIGKLVDFVLSLTNQ